MAAAFGSTVVWEWTNDQGDWSPYEADVSNFIEDNYASQSNVVRLADIDRNLSSLAVDLGRMVQVGQYGIERPIRRELYDCDSAVAHGAMWQWGGDNSRQRNVRYTWHSYSMEVANMLEAAYSQNRYSVVDLDVSPINQPYVVDLSQMKQINKTSAFARPVQRLLSGANYRTLTSGSYQQQAGSNSQSWQQYLGSFFPKGGASNSGPSGFGSASNTGPSGFGSGSNSGPSGFGSASNSGPSGFGSASNSGPSGFGGASNSGPSGFGSASNSGPSGFGSASNSGTFGFGSTSQPVPMSVSVPGHSKTASAVAATSWPSIGSHSSGFNFASPSYPPASQTTFAFGGASSTGNSVLPSVAAASASTQPTGARPKKVRALRRNLTPGFSSDPASASSSMSAPTSNWSSNVNGPTSSGAQGTSAKAFTAWRDPSNQTGSSSSGNHVHFQPTAPSASAGSGTGSSSSGGSTLFGAVSDLISGLSGMVVSTYRYVVTGGNLNQSVSTSVASSVVPAAVPPTITSNAAKSGARSIGGSYVNTKRLKVSGKNSVPQDDLSHVQRLTANDVLTNYIKEVKKPPAKEDCCICCDSLREASGYGQGNSYTVVQLVKCSHMFHVDCISAMYDSNSKNGSIQCPSCKTIYGTKYGNCPNGNMEYTVIPNELSGYSGCSTIEIKYTIFSGVQGNMHPNPGLPYKVRGFPRHGYLPNNHEGQKVLSLLTSAWRRRLTFTIGTSVTTGEPDVVVWNEIHHKTEMTDASGHGYPDPNYLSNVMLELAAHGVTDDSQ